MSLKQAINSYLLWKSTYAPSASIQYQTRLKPLMDVFGSDTEVNSITGDNISSYHLQMENEGYSNGTVAYSTRILKNFFEDRFKNSVHPLLFRFFKIFCKKTTKGKFHWLTKICLDFLICEVYIY